MRPFLAWLTLGTVTRVAQTLIPVLDVGTWYQILRTIGITGWCVRDVMANLAGARAMWMLTMCFTLCAP